MADPTPHHLRLGAPVQITGRLVKVRDAARTTAGKAIPGEDLVVHTLVTLDTKMDGYVMGSRVIRDYLVVDGMEGGAYSVLPTTAEEGRRAYLVAWTMGRRPHLCLPEQITPAPDPRQDSLW